MKRVLVAFVLVAMFARPFAGADAEVDEHLAQMVEEVVAETGISINISESSLTSVSISRVNNVAVSQPSAEPDVRRLQAAFDEHPFIFENIGPVLRTTTDCNGHKVEQEPDASSVFVTVSINPGCFEVARPN